MSKSGNVNRAKSMFIGVVFMRVVWRRKHFLCGRRFCGVQLYFLFRNVCCCVGAWCTPYFFFQSVFRLIDVGSVCG